METSNIYKDQVTHHASDDVRIHSPVNEGLLLALEESLDGSLHVLLHGSFQGLGGGDAAHDLSAVSGHQGSEGADDSIEIADPGDGYNED